MEVEEIQTQACKYPRIGEIGEENGESMKRCLNSNNNNSGGGGGDGGGNNRLRGWHHHHSSRIIRVSRASGGKDRHSKVWTSKGLRDRRVRLSVTTAIQFYDLQDRLGYDQPSKAVEWLIKAAADAIAELPSLNTSFPDEKMASNENLDDCNLNQNNNQTFSLSRSACSSTSETSKNSGNLSLSRSEIKGNRVKARERARERTAKEKEKEDQNMNNNNSSNMSQNPTFTELLTGSINANSHDNASQNGSVHQNPTRQWIAAAAPMDYLLGTSSIQLANSNSLSHHHSVAMQMPPPFSISSNSDDHPHSHHQELSFVPDHLIPPMAGPGGGSSYNIDFNISSGVSLAGFNRGTLQSNSPSPLFNATFQRITSEAVSGVPFFMATSPTENHNHHHHHHHHNTNQFPAGFDGRLQLYYDNGCRNSDNKGKGKN